MHGILTSDTMPCSAKLEAHYGAMFLERLIMILGIFASMKEKRAYQEFIQEHAKQQEIDLANTKISTAQNSLTGIIAARERQALEAHQSNDPLKQKIAIRGIANLYDMQKEVNQAAILVEDTKLAIILNDLRIGLSKTLTGFFNAVATSVQTYNPIALLFAKQKAEGALAFGKKAAGMANDLNFGEPSGDSLREAEERVKSLVNGQQGSSSTQGYTHSAQDQNPSARTMSAAVSGEELLASLMKQP